MEDILADEILELSTSELVKVLREFKKDDNDAYEKLKEIIEDQF